MVDQTSVLFLEHPADQPDISPRKRHPTTRPSFCIPFHFGPLIPFDSNIQIRENADIKGIIIDETEIKLSANADDGSLFVSDIHSLQLSFSYVINSENPHH